MAQQSIGNNRRLSLQQTTKPVPRNIRGVVARGDTMLYGQFQQVKRVQQIQLFRPIRVWALRSIFIRKENNNEQISQFAT